MRILVATDAWHPQVNGVVRTYTRLATEAKALGTEIVFLTPEQFRSFRCPGYPEIHLAIPSPGRASRAIEASGADFVHIATEGPVGWTARSYCLRHGRPFTTSYHTKFPEYATALLSLPAAWAWAPVCRFHAKSSGVMVAAPSMARELAERGFARILPWTRGVDTGLFRPQDIRLFGRDKPVFLYAGRVSKEKNIEAFLDAELPGLKVVVGDGPHLAALRRRYPSTIFPGVKHGDELARHYASADVFVFPSKTDTFGLVILEALASGLPVAAFPVTGPLDIVQPGRSGILDSDLAAAARMALTLSSDAARARALQFTWANAALAFIENVRTANARAALPAGSDNRPLSPPGGNAIKRNLIGDTSP